MKQTLAEKYISARAATSLKHTPDTVSSPVDILTAAGMVGHRHGLVMQLWEVTCRPSLAHINSLAEKLAMKLDSYMLVKKIRAREHALDISKEVLAWHLWGTCPHCKGRGEGTIEGTPHLNGIDCSHCNGTGKVQLVTTNDEAANWLRGEIESLAVSAEAAMKSKVRG